MVFYPNPISLQGRIINNTVKSFLTDLTGKLKKLWAAEKETMLKLKEAEAEELGFNFDGKINKEDFW